MGDWAQALAKAGPDTLIFAFVGFLVFHYADDYGPVGSLALGAGVLILYIVGRYALISVQIREAKERAKIEAQTESINLFTKHASPSERDVLYRIEQESRDRRKP